MNIAILGNGAMGNLLALKCHKLDQAFSLMTRDPTPFTLSATDLDKQQYAINLNLVSVAQVAQFDLLILPVKAYQVIPALKSMANKLTARQTLLLLHNGMGVLDEALALLPQIPLIAATTSHAAYKSDFDQVHETGQGVSHCGYVNPPDISQQSRLNALLNALLTPCTWHEDISAALWQKLAINAAINPVTALQQIKNGQLMQPDYSAVIANICAETANVMQASGYPVTVQQLVEAVHQVIASSKDNYSSMYQDILNGRPTEIDFINGYIVQQGRKLGLQTPINDRLVGEIHRRETHS